jgi:hypothetical protein
MATLLRPSVKHFDKTRTTWAVHSGIFTATNAACVRGYLDEVNDQKQLDKINNFIGKYPYIGNLVIDFKMTISQQLKTIDTINKAIDKYGLAIIGALENNVLAKNPEPIDDDYIEKLATGVFNDDGESLTTPIDLSGFCLSYAVKELTAKNELLHEGIAMKHCVGGYSTSVKNKQSRIFHIAIAGHHTTLEISNKGIQQHFGPNNSKPDIQSTIVADVLISYLKYKELSTVVTSLSDNTDDKIDYGVVDLIVRQFDLLGYIIDDPDAEFFKYLK